MATSSLISPTSYNLSAARLDSTTVPLWAEVAAVRKALAVHPRLALWSGTAAPRGKHPVLVDLFRVSQGRVEVGRSNQHGLSTLAGSSFGAWCGLGGGSAAGIIQGALAGSTMGSHVGDWLGPAGALLGAATGWMAGGMLGAMAGVVPGVTMGARLGAATAKMASQRLSDTVGTYDEVLVGVPDVVVRGEGERRHLFVLGMYTNSAVARWGDRVFAFGYRKQPATIVQEPFRTFQLAAGRRTLMSVEFSPVAADGWQPLERSGTDLLLNALRQPLLGVTEHGTLARSILRRDFGDPMVRGAAPPDAIVRLGHGFSAVLPEGSYSAHPLSESEPWGVLHARSVMSRLSFPSALVEPPVRRSRPAS